MVKRKLKGTKFFSTKYNAQFASKKKYDAQLGHTQAK